MWSEYAASKWSQTCLSCEAFFANREGGLLQGPSFRWGWVLLLSRMLLPPRWEHGCVEVKKGWMTASVRAGLSVNIRGRSVPAVNPADYCLTLEPGSRTPKRLRLLHHQFIPTKRALCQEVSVVQFFIHTGVRVEDFPAEAELKSSFVTTVGPEMLSWWQTGKKKMLNVP